MEIRKFTNVFVGLSNDNKLILAGMLESDKRLKEKLLYLLAGTNLVELWEDEPQFNLECSFRAKVSDYLYNPICREYSAYRLGDAVYSEHSTWKQIAEAMVEYMEEFIFPVFASGKGGREQLIPEMLRALEVLEIETLMSLTKYFKEFEGLEI